MAAEVEFVEQSKPEEPPPPAVPPFLRDLRALYADIRPIDPVEYLPKLETLFKSRRASLATRREQFLNGLLSIYTHIAPIRAEAHLDLLRAKFEDARRTRRARMADRFCRLPDDDPLRCPISLFGIIDQGRLETAQTRALAWLLDPRREHGFGNVFIRDLLQLLDEDSKIEDVRVDQCEPEFAVTEGRLDVYARGTARRGGESEGSWSWMLMVEAKVGATESHKQLLKYDRWAERSSGGQHVFRLFLTPDGRLPESSDEDWKPMSFLDLACIFRKRCAELTATPGYHFLRFYLASVLKEICGWKVPIGNPELVSDPYDVVEYLEAVFPSQEPQS